MSEIGLCWLSYDEQMMLRRLLKVAGANNDVREASRAEMTNFISREQVLAILKRHGAADIQKEVESLFRFPAPNPDMSGNRNIMGQTEDEFWNAVERQEKSGANNDVRDAMAGQIAELTHDNEALRAEIEMLQHMTPTSHSWEQSAEDEYGNRETIREKRR